MNPLEALDKAIEALLERYPEEWPSFVCYILEALQDHTDEEAYDTFLHQLNAEIAARIGAGRW